MAAELSHTSPILADALVILGAAGIVIPLFARLRITPIIGFILVGVAVGPFGLGQMIYDYPWLSHFTITDPENLKPFAEFGIILLLFSIGLELSFNRLWQMRKLVFGLGALELIIISMLLTSFLTMAGQYWTGALALGLALALSSTALVLPMSGTKTPVGRAALSMLLFEDIAIVPIIFLLGVLAPFAAMEETDNLMSAILTGAAVIIAMLVLGRIALPHLFAQAARTKSPEVFLAASLLVVIGASLVTAAVGLSPIVGALVAGLLIAETEYHTEVEGITEPFKGLALGVFLLTVGMSIDLTTIWDNIGIFALAVAGVLSLKAAVTAVLLRLMGAHRSTAAETGILMASPSETTLIVLAAATQALLIQPGTAQFWQIVTAIGLTITPLLALLGKFAARRMDVREQVEDAISSSQPRTVILGFGRVGRMVADMLSTHGKPYIAVDADADIILAARREGYKVAFGHASRIEALDKLGIAQASAVVLTMDEPILVQSLTRKLRTSYKDLPIIARARDQEHAAALYRAGASVAVPETLESSLQLSEAVLVDIGVPMGPVIASIHQKRDEYRKEIQEKGELAHRPMLRTSTKQA